MLLLSGCESLTPIISAKHISDPSIDNDGYDLVCAGAKTKKRLSLKGSWCKNIRGGDLIDIEIEYEF